MALLQGLLHYQSSWILSAEDPLSVVCIPVPSFLICSNLFLFMKLGFGYLTVFYKLVSGFEYVLCWFTKSANPKSLSSCSYACCCYTVTLVLAYCVYYLKCRVKWLLYIGICHEYMIQYGSIFWTIQKMASSCIHQSRSMHQKVHGKIKLRINVFCYKKLRFPERILSKRLMEMQELCFVD